MCGNIITFLEGLTVRKGITHFTGSPPNNNQAIEFSVSHQRNGGEGCTHRARELGRYDSLECTGAYWSS